MAKRKSSTVADARHEKRLAAALAAGLKFRINLDGKLLITDPEGWLDLLAWTADERSGFLGWLSKKFPRDFEIVPLEERAALCPAEGWDCTDAIIQYGFQWRRHSDGGVDYIDLWSGKKRGEAFRLNALVHGDPVAYGTTSTHQTPQQIPADHWRHLELSLIPSPLRGLEYHAYAPAGEPYFNLRFFPRGYLAPTSH